MGKHISTRDLSDTLHLSKCTDGYWLYDDTRGMNLAMRADTEEDALLEALEYYQRRLQEVEESRAQLANNVESFLTTLRDTEDDPFNLQDSYEEY